MMVIMTWCVHIKADHQVKIAYILSNINKALAFEWIACGLREEFDLFFILLYPGESHLEKFLREKNIKVYPVYYSGKKDLLPALFKIRRILTREKADIVHAHLLDGGLAGLYAARLAGVKKRIYTRHHATSHHVYHPHAVRYDRLINRMATKVVATSLNVKQVLMEKEGVSEGKIEVIHHGFDLSAFANEDAGKVLAMKLRYNPDSKSPVIGVISRYIELKGIQYTVEAFKKILTAFPGALLILANSTGRYKAVITAMLKELPQGSYLEIPFENDLVHLYRLFDVHVHVPVDSHSEAFGQTYVEALAAGIPSVFTMSGVAPEFISNRRNALVVPFRNSEAIAASVMELLADKDLMKLIIDNGRKDVWDKFSIEGMLSALKKLYRK